MSDERKVLDWGRFKEFLGTAENGRVDSDTFYDRFRKIYKEHSLISVQKNHIAPVKDNTPEML